MPVMREVGALVGGSVGELVVVGAVVGGSAETELVMNRAIATATNVVEFIMLMLFDGQVQCLSRPAV